VGITPAPAAPVRCLHWATDITNSLAKASYRQRVTHITEALSFLSESDKDQVMGRAILARLGWVSAFCQGNEDNSP